MLILWFLRKHFFLYKNAFRQLDPKLRTIGNRTIDQSRLFPALRKIKLIKNKIFKNELKNALAGVWIICLEIFHKKIII
jgi:hypothetical protein